MSTLCYYFLTIVFCKLLLLNVIIFEFSIGLICVYSFPYIFAFWKPVKLLNLK